MRRTVNCLTAVQMGLLLFVIPFARAEEPAGLPAGPGSFQFTDAKGDRDHALTVWTYVPSDATENSPIVFVMHGVRRNGRDYRDNWIEHADRYRFILIVPEFPTDRYPSSSYQQGNMLTDEGKQNHSSQWTFSAIEHLFDHVLKISGNTSEGYYIYGHSAGGQFVHRFALFMPDARYIKAIAANPGWYTLPDPQVAYPYGLKGTVATGRSLSEAFSHSFVLMLGAKDNDPNDPNLRTTEKANAQGATRFERGQYYFGQVQNAANQLKTNLRWSKIVVADAKHSDRQMSEAAAKVLFTAAR